MNTNINIFSRRITLIPVSRMALAFIIALGALWTGGQAPSIPLKAAVPTQCLSELRGREAVDHFKQDGLYASPVVAGRYKAVADHQLPNPARSLRATFTRSVASVAPQQTPICSPLPLVEQQKIVVDNGAANDLFGRSLVISGNTVVVGAPGNNGSRGAAYVSTRSGTIFTQQQIITDPGGAANDQFGFSTAISGNTLVIGAPGDNGNQGAAYVYVFNGTSWVLQQKLTALDGAGGDQFGEAVAISGDTVVIGARFDNGSQGSAYVFTRSGTTWSETQKLTASDGVGGDFFGEAVAIDGDTIAVGAFFDATIHTFQGSAYVFTRSGTTFTQTQKLLASNAGPAGMALFGTSLAIVGNTLLVGADRAAVNGVVDQGAVYVFMRSGTTFTETQILTASDGVAGDRFGEPIAFDGNTAVIGADFADIGMHIDQGAAYVFAFNGTTFTQQQKLTASDGAADDQFSTAVGVSGNTVAVGAPFANIGADADQGAAYIFSCQCPMITLSPNVLPDGAVGVPYSQTITPSAGAAPFQFSVTSNFLPEGLTLSPTTGVISGTPTVPGEFAFTVQVTDANGCTGQQDYTMTVTSTGPTITPETLPGGSVCSPYNQTLTAEGGTGSFTFSVSMGVLPPSLTLSPAGVISGILTTEGIFSFTVTATDANGLQESRNYTINVTPSTITILPEALPDGVVGAPYNQTLTATGGTGPFTFSILDGALPSGLTLSATGVISGSLTAAGSFNFAVQATDANGCTGTNARNYTIDVAAPTPPPSSPTPGVLIGRSNDTARNVGLALVLGGVGAAVALEATRQPHCQPVTLIPANTALPAAQVGQPYTQTFVASGAASPYTFTIKGSPPPGLTLDSSGALSGSPTAAGTFSFSVAAIGPNNCGGEHPYTLAVNLPSISVIINPGTLPSGTAGLAYNQSLTASGGAAPFSFSVTSGSLPTGLTLTATGLISGTPASPGTSQFTALATDRNGQTGSKGYSFTVNPPCSSITLKPATLPNGEAGQEYSQTLNATGGTGPFTFSLLSGALPSGLILYLTTGSISGKPWQASNFNFAIKVTDSGGCAGSAAYSLKIAPRKFTTVSAASNKPLVAPKEVVTGFGSELSDTTASASSPRLPASLEGMRVVVRDRAGVERAAPLLLISPSLISYQIPGGAAAGAATVSVFRGEELVAAGSAQIVGPRPPSSPKTKTAARRRERTP